MVDGHEKYLWCRRLGPAGMQTETTERDAEFLCGVINDHPALRRSDDEALRARKVMA